MSSIYTVGHSAHPLDAFVALLRAHGVQALADVRRHPGSRAHPQFGETALAESLGLNGIAYHPFTALGGRRRARVDSPNTVWQNASFRGYADYMETDAFVAAYQALCQLALAATTAVMCAEGMWWQCHRALIADALKADGWQVLHVFPDGKVKEHPYTPAARIENGQLRYGAGLV